MNKIIFAVLFFFNIIIGEPFIDLLSKQCQETNEEYYINYLNKIKFFSQDPADRDVQLNNDLIYDLQDRGGIFFFEKTLAAKILEVSLLEREDTTNRIIEELKNMKLFMNETYIIHEMKTCKFHKTDRESVVILIFMQLMQRTLDRELKVNRKSVSGIFEMCLDRAFKIAIALSKIHMKKLIHGDIKSENVLMSDRFTPVLADLELMTHIDHVNLFSGSFGPYMDPEFEKRNAHNFFFYDQQSDIYALGILFVENFGKIKLTNEKNEEIINKLEIVDENQDQKIEQLRRLIKDMIHPEKKFRIKSMDDVIKRLIDVYYYYYNNVKTKDELTLFFSLEFSYYSNLKNDNTRYKRIYLLQERKKLFNFVLMNRNYEVELRQLLQDEKPFEIIINQGEEQFLKEQQYLQIQKTGEVEIKSEKERPNLNVIIQANEIRPTVKNLIKKQLMEELLAQMREEQNKKEEKKEKKTKAREEGFCGITWGKIFGFK